MPCSNDPLDKKTALLAIDELIRAKATVDNSARVVALTRCIKTVMNSCNDNRILKQAAQARPMCRLRCNHFAPPVAPHPRCA